MQIRSIPEVPAATTALDWAEFSLVSARLDCLRARRDRENRHPDPLYSAYLRQEIDEAMAERERIFARLIDHVPAALSDD